MPARISLLRRFLRQPARRRALLLEALFWLGLARLALRFLSFRRIVWFLKRPYKQRKLAAIERVQVRQDVSWAVRQTAPYLPGETVCFPSGLAAQAMLRRRGIDAALYYGAATLPNRGLTTHVWVKDGLEGVVGHQVASKYHVLARYPNPGRD